jgi:hypothetical protein
MLKSLVTTTTTTDTPGATPLLFQGHVKGSCSRTEVYLLHRVIHLRCHEKKRKHCRKESTLLLVNDRYTCRRYNTFVFQHINTQHDCHVARSISGVICAEAAVIFCRNSASFCGLRPYTSDLTYAHTKKSGGVKSWEFAGHGMGSSRPPQRLLHVSSENWRDFRGL